jgi:hypothetical protein
VRLRECLNRRMGIGSRAGRRASLVGLVLLAAGCGGSGGAQSASLSPVQTALSWFDSLNDKDLKAAVAHFTPASQDMMDWNGGDTALWPSFSAVRCRQLSKSRSTASVLCTFKESHLAAGYQADTFWAIGMVRQTTRPWLINNYGQG